MKRENRIGSGLISNMALSGICKPASMIMGYIYVPIVLSFLGTEKYGIWSTLLTILSWISYFDIGIGNGLRNKLAESITAGRCKKKPMFDLISICVRYTYYFLGDYYLLHNSSPNGLE